MSDQKTNLKILHLLSQRPDSTGSGIYIQAMMREAKSRGHINYLLAGIQAGQDPDLECISENECSYVRFTGPDTSCAIVGMSDVMPYESRRFYDLDDNDLEEYEQIFRAKLTGVLQDYRPDIIHSHHLWILTSLVRQMIPDLPLVTSAHGSDLRQFQKCSHLQSRVLAGCRKVDAVMALSSAQKNEIRDLYHIPEHKIRVTGAGFNSSLFSMADKPEPHPVQIVYAGKLSYAKGVPWMLRALEGIRAPEWKLHLIGSGSGPEKQECLRLAENLDGRVMVHGSLPQDQVAGLMKQSHIFVLPSFYEGLALVILEALACGCRIVATRLPGTTEVLGDIEADFIRLIKPPRLHSVDTPCPEDETLFERTLRKAISDQLSRAARKEQIDISIIQARINTYTWGRVFERVEQVYYDTIEKMGR